MINPDGKHNMYAPAYVEDLLKPVRKYFLRHWLKHRKADFIESSSYERYGEPTAENIELVADNPNSYADMVAYMKINGKRYRNVSILHAYEKAVEELVDEINSSKLKRGQHAMDIVYKPVIINPHNNMPQEAFSAVMALVTHAAALEEELARARVALYKSSEVLNDVVVDHSGKIHPGLLKLTNEAFGLSIECIQRIDAWIGADK